MMRIRIFFIFFLFCYLYTALCLFMGLIFVAAERVGHLGEHVVEVLASLDGIAVGRVGVILHEGGGHGLDLGQGVVDGLLHLVVELDS